MDQSLRLWCSHGGVVNGLSYEGGFTQILITDCSITLDSLRSLIIESFSIQYEFILRHVYETHCFLLDCQQAWSFVLEINLQSSFISIFVTQVSPRLDYISTQRVSNYEAGPSSSRHIPIASHEEDDTLALHSNDDFDDFQSIADSDDLVENLDDDIEDNDNNGTTNELFVGQYFDSRSAFRTFISDLAIENKFTCSVSVMNNAKGIIYTCNQPTCRWRVYARPIRRGNIFQIATLENRHSCLSGLTTGSHPLATSSWIKNKIINIIRDNQSYSPSQVVMDIHREHRINISYSKAWRAREMALAEINGSYFDAYASLEEYSFRIIESNPGSSCFLKTTENNSFQRIFICFKACINGFLGGCLPIISTDATFLSSKYQGILFIACAHDPNYKLYPIAYAVAEG
ncbi:uncharacterized protein M6B38_141805 [Iris pallida]|uniref:Transposase MuDR plant domain-containing protein n=1 Tax=Iris pallida TaxID=29817 RepID=A0AAX6FCH3_IRIPA|nr:uncharacterized protein M6B38_141805 [Iris pallida]